MSTMRRRLDARFPVVRSLLLLISVAAMVFVLTQSINGVGERGDEDVPDLYFTEIQSTGTREEWVELANTGDHPVNLHEYAITTEGGWRGPGSFFGDYGDLSEFGVSALIDNQTYYLNAEDLYVDTHYSAGDDSLDCFYLIKVKESNEYDTYYHVGGEFRVWWDNESKDFLTGDEKDSFDQAYQESNVYQILVPGGWFHRLVFIQLDPDNDLKYETDQDIFEYDPGPLNGTFPLQLDMHSPGATNESLAFHEYIEDEYNLTVQASTLQEIYVRSDLDQGTFLDLTADDDGTFLTRVNLTDSPHFWRIDSLPHDGIIFVNDNQPETMYYYNRLSGERVDAPGVNIVEIDLTNDEHFDHHVGEPYFSTSFVQFGDDDLWIDFTDPNIAPQITTVTLTAPILTDTVFVNKNTGAFSNGPAGGNIVEINLDIMADDYSWLFPRGATYIDYTLSSTPIRSLDHLIVVDDRECDHEGNKNELLANGRLYIWNNKEESYEGPRMGWGTGGPAPEPTGLWSTQAYFNGNHYHWGSMWTLGTESRGEDNSVPAPAYGSADVVINEINPAFVELYNRGGSSVRVTGWKLTGEGNTYTLSGTLYPGGFKIITESHFYIPFTPSTGGRLSLFDDLGVLTSSVGFQTDVSGDQYSWCARHIDGVGVDYRFNDTMGQPWANGVVGAQKNADWDHAVPRSTASENYDGLTFLQIGSDSEGNYNILDEITEYNPDWKDGCYGTEGVGDLYLGNWDVVVVVDGLDETNAGLLNEYLEGGGRLYVEHDDWSDLQGTELYQTLRLMAHEYHGMVTNLSGQPPITDGMMVGYNGTVESKFTSSNESHSVWEGNEGDHFTVLRLHFDPYYHDNSYRVVASSVRYEHMSELTRGDDPQEYVGSLVDFFLLDDDEFNHRPEIELLEPLPEPGIELYKTGPVLLWENHDPDVWDQVAGNTKYTLFIHTDQEKVVNMDMDARSLTAMGITERAWVVDEGDIPVSGIYYWGIFAEDTFGKTVYEHGGAFELDIDEPVVVGLTPMIGDLYDDPLPIGSPRCFCACPGNNGNSFGRPDRFAVRLRDNQGLVFDNDHNVVIKLLSPGYIPPATVNWTDVLYSYEGDYEEDLPLFHLTVDWEGTDGNILSLTREKDVTFFMVPDGPIPDGRYVVHIIAADLVQRGGYMNWSFEIDFSGPKAPVDFTLSPEPYRDALDILYLKEGETYTLSVTSESRYELTEMSNVEFQEAATMDEHATWEKIGADFITNDALYSASWTPTSGIHYLRAVASDTRSHYAVSEVFGPIVVDGTGPEEPLWLKATLDLDHPVRARIQGYVTDTGVEGQMSGVDHVVIWHYDSLTGSMVKVRQGDDALEVPVQNDRFDHYVNVDVFSSLGEDVTHAFFAQAIDRVGNQGTLSDMAVWTDTGLAEPIRVITPATIRDVPMTTRVQETYDSLDEVRSITVTFTGTEVNFLNYLFTMRSGILRNESHLADLGLPPDCSFLWGYFNMDLTPGLTDFEAKVTIEFHLSSGSQLGTKTADILNRIRLVSREQRGDGKWRMVDLVGGEPQTVDPAKGLYRVRARVGVFGDYAIVVAKSDLTVSEISVGEGKTSAGEEVTVNVKVHNGGAFPVDALNVRVTLFIIDGEGNQYFVGEIDYGTIESGFRYHPDEAAIHFGNGHGHVVLEIPDYLGDDENVFISLRAQVDTDGYVREVNETNNELNERLRVYCPPSPPTLRILGPPHGSRVNDPIYFYGEVDDNIGYEHIEYRIDRETAWQEVEEFEGWTLPNGKQHWHMNYNSATLEDGLYTFKFRASDGKQYSDAMTVQVRVDRSEREESLVEIPRSLTLFLLCAALLVLFGTLVFVVKAPSEFFERSRQPPESDLVPGPRYINRPPPPDPQHINRPPPPDPRQIDRPPPPDPPSMSPVPRRSPMYDSFAPFGPTASPSPSMIPESTDAVKDAVSISICRHCGTPIPPGDPGETSSVTHCTTCGKAVPENGSSVREIIPVESSLVSIR